MNADPNADMKSSRHWGVRRNTPDDFCRASEGIFGEIRDPGAVRAAIRQRAAIELCSRSLIWKERYALALNQ